MAVSQNKLLPVLGGVGLLVVGTIVYQQMRGPDAPVKAGSPLTSIPQPPPLPKTAKSGAAGADADSPSEALATVAASNRALRADVAKVLEENRRLVEEAQRNAGRSGRRTGETAEVAPGDVLGASAASVPASPVSPATPASAQAGRGQPTPGTGAATGASSTAATASSNAPRNGFEAALETAAVAAQQIRAAMPASLGSSQPGQAATPSRRRRSAEPQGAAREGAPTAEGAAATSTGAETSGRASAGLEGERATLGAAPGAVSYVSRAPMGYAVVDDRSAGGGRSGPQTRYVRTLASAQSADGTPPSGQGVAMAAAAAAQADSAKKEAVPYFTLPENSTLTGVRAMTSIIGRVPIDGRVTDPMQFKAMIGRDNLAANGWEMPQDLAGIIVSGIAIGDMALSCSEGKVRSLTFVFNDGAIRTVSARSRAASMGGGGGSAPLGGGDLGFISDSHGNPCIVGKFVTNAPAYLGDIMGLRTVGLASQAFADAQRVVTQNAAGGQTTQISDANKYAMGQAVNGASEELSKWMMSRLKNSFDAVVTPAGAELNNLVVHLDQEVRLDKLPGGRRIVHRMQEGASAQRGGRYGLE